MKVIDLLNKIANGEEVPKKIKKTWVYEWSFDEVRDDFSYITKEGCRFDSDWLVLDMLDDEVEIIEEEKEIEKIPYHYNFGYIDCGDLKIEVVEELSKNFNYFADKINELIDVVNSINKGK